jgi:hypothetical protein
MVPANDFKRLENERQAVLGELREINKIPQDEFKRRYFALPDTYHDRVLVGLANGLTLAEAERLAAIEISLDASTLQRELYERTGHSSFFGKKPLTEAELEAKERVVFGKIQEDIKNNDLELMKFKEGVVQNKKEDEEEEKKSSMVAKQDILFGGKNEKPDAYIERSLKPNSKDGLKEFTADVRRMIYDPKGEYDREWKSLEGAAGLPKKLSKDPINRAEERAAALMGRVLTQENMQPMLDKEKDKNVRGVALDILFGRDIK